MFFLTPLVVIDKNPSYANDSILAISNIASIRVIFSRNTYWLIDYLCFFLFLLTQLNEFYIVFRIPTKFLASLVRFSTVDVITSYQCRRRSLFHRVNHIRDAWSIWHSNVCQHYHLKSSKAVSIHLGIKYKPLNMACKNTKAVTSSPSFSGLILH